MLLFFRNSLCDKGGVSNFISNCSLQDVLAYFLRTYLDLDTTLVQKVLVKWTHQILKQSCSLKLPDKILLYFIGSKVSPIHSLLPSTEVYFSLLSLSWSRLVVCLKFLTWFDHHPDLKSFSRGASKFLSFQNQVVKHLSKGVIRQFQKKICQLVLWDLDVWLKIFW